MISTKNKFKTIGLILVASVMVLSACNKELEEITGPAPVVPTGLSLTETLVASPNDSLFYKILARAGKLPLLSDKSKRFTIFSPDNAAIRSFINAATGGLIPPPAPESAYVAFINSILRPGQADTLVMYHIIPQSVPTSSIPTTFPNFPYPTLFNPAAALSPFARLDAYISRRTNGAWKDNIPIIVPDIITANGVIHRIAAVTVPPSQLLLTRINTDTDLTYLRAAILRADSGATISTVGSLQYFLGDVSIQLGANFTVFAPTNLAFQNVLYAAAFGVVRAQIFQFAYAQAIGAGATPAQATAIANAAADTNAPAQTTLLVSTPAIFSNPALYPFLTATQVKGILFYHLLGVRAFTVNLPTTDTNIPTLLNAAISAHPGISVKATFTGPFVSSATVKGLFNAAPSNILINPFPGGSSDQRFVNGVLHKIDQVLIPAPF